MHQISQEIINKYEVRKTKQQKQHFLDYMSENMEAQGYEVTIEVTGSMKSRNLVMGNPETADIVLTAHYDTCAWMPFPNFIIPAHPVWSTLLQTAEFAGIFVVCYLISALLLALMQIPISYALGVCTTVYALFLIQIFIGFANPHTMNDNTSGVVELVEIACELPQSLYSHIAFIFFDHEEIGMVGSRSYANTHKAELNDTVILNFDCIGDGKDIFLQFSKQAYNMKMLISSAQESIIDKNEYKLHVESDQHKLYPSDHKNFPVSAAVYAARYHSMIGYYLHHLHTHKDRICDEGNVEFLKAYILSFILTYIGKREEVKESKSVE